jgi:hypothetical protein
MPLIAALCAPTVHSPRPSVCLHIGCGAQLKNRWQIFWCLTEGKRLEVRICHNFFQSCHGKGPSDSEGGVEKRNLRHCEFKKLIELNSNKQDLDKDAIFLKRTTSSMLSRFFHVKAAEKAAKLVADVAAFWVTKKRHTICSRTHHFVQAGVVDHLTRPDITACDDITSNFCFCPTLSKSGGALLTVPNTTAMTERSCYECDSCFALDKGECKLTKYTGSAVSRLFVLNASNGSGLATRRATREAALLTKLKRKIKCNSNVVISIEEEDGSYSWALAKALGAPRKAHAGEKDHDNVALGSGSLVVDVLQYELLKGNGTEFGSYAEAQAAFESDPQSVSYCLRTPLGMCEKQWCSCGTSAGCMKQHTQTYKLALLREPAGFALSTPKPAEVRRSRRNMPNGAPLVYRLSTGVLQSVLQNVGVLDVS